MKFGQKFMTIIAISGMTVLFGVGATIITSTPTVTIAQADSITDQQAINDIMPNQKLQQLVLLNLKHEGIVPDSFQLGDFTLESFKPIWLS